MLAKGHHPWRDGEGFLLDQHTACVSLFSLKTVEFTISLEFNQYKIVLLSMGVSGGEMFELTGQIASRWKAFLILTTCSLSTASLVAWTYARSRLVGSQVS